MQNCSFGTPELFDESVSSGIYRCVTPSLVPTGHFRAWKIHVSARTDIANATLDVIWRSATKLRYSFKYVARYDDLAALNDGSFGLSQIGKFITIYPSSADHLKEIIVDLLNGLPSTQSPRVPFDCQVANHSNLFLRFGAFNFLQIREPIGGIASGWMTKDGQAVLDNRTSAPPDEAIAQLEEIGIEVVEKRSPPLLSQRYVATDLIHRGPRGSIFLGVDTEELSQVIIKSAHKLDRISERDRRSSVDRLKREHRALQKAVGLGVSPQPYFFEEQGDEAFLVMEHLEGTSLQTQIQSVLLSCQRPNLDAARKIFDELIAATEALKRLGIHHGDLSPRNIISSTQGLKVVDFEHVIFSSDLEFGAWSSGTPGFSMEPKLITSQTELDHRCRYSIESVYFFLATGRDDASTFPSAPNAIKWVRNIDWLPKSDVERVSSLSNPSSMKTKDVASHLLSDGASLYDGLAGKIFASQYLEKPSQGGVGNPDELINKVKNSPLHPGFVVGSLGVAHTLRRFLNSPDAAAEIEADAFCIPNSSPDFLNGRAGQLRYFVQKYLLTEDTRALLVAQNLANRLCEEYQASEAGWRMPKGYGDLSNKVHVGYAHGSAGIVDCLIDYYRISACPECLKIIQHFERSVSSRFEILDSMWTWPEGNSDGGGASWCHGAVGIGRFYLGYADVDQSRARSVVKSISKYLFENTRWQGLHYCHGLAGTIDFLFDVGRKFESTDDERRATVLSEAVAVLVERDRYESNSLYTSQLGLALVTTKQKFSYDIDLLRFT